MPTDIQWAATPQADGTVIPGETWNPTVGCDRISPGCARCYAKELHDRRHKAFLAGKKMAPHVACFAARDRQRQRARYHAKKPHAAIRETAGAIAAARPGGSD